MTRAFLRGEAIAGPGHEAGFAVVAILWLACIWVGSVVLRIPIVRIEAEGSSIVVTEIRPYGTRVRSAPVSDVAPPVIRKNWTGEDQPSYSAVLTLPDGHDVTVAEDSRREVVEAAVSRIERAIRPA